MERLLQTTFDHVETEINLFKACVQITEKKLEIAGENVRCLNELQKPVIPQIFDEYTKNGGKIEEGNQITMTSAVIKADPKMRPVLMYGLTRNGGIYEIQTSEGTLIIEISAVGEPKYIVTKEGKSGCFGKVGERGYHQYPTQYKVSVWDPKKVMQSYENRLQTLQEDVGNLKNLAQK